MKLPWSLQGEGKVRRGFIAAVSLNTFVDLISLFPILYVDGYITPVTNWLFGNSVVNEFLLALGYWIGSAITSGVLGNFVYDQIKRVYQKKV